ncbi:MAG TPA: hypothetical protein VFN33_02710 [Gaiellaceae bacterium]|nr:hypothetical protein [Gaiellaceae bacterium]
MERSHAQRAHPQSSNPIPGERLLKGLCPHSIGGTSREEQDHVVGREASQRKRERARRQGIEPLSVVDREEKPPFAANKLQQIAYRNRQRTAIYRIRRRLLAQQHNLEGATPRRQQHRQSVVDDQLEEINQPNAVECPLRLHRPRRKHHQSRRARLLDPRLP